ncbi:MAG TPA: enoyl-CoA hydratase-related protein [Acidimicrobiales bacterium]
MAIRYEQPEDHIVLITIDRPPRNALDMYAFRDLAGAWRTFRDDPDAWVAVVTGSGDSFCVGADLKTYIPQITQLSQDISAGNVTEIDGCKLSDGTFAVLRPPKVRIYKPIVAAVNGFCTAGGMEMLCGTDIRLASPDAQFAVMEPKRGLFAGGGTTVRLPRQLPFPLAMELLLTADLVPAERALAMGLINEIVSKDRLVDAALDLARRIAANAPLAVQATKESVLRGLAADYLAALEIETELAQKIFATEDAKEGPKAFAEKRPPVWQGR